MTKPLIILDRDGVINHDSDQYIKSADEWVAYPESMQAIAKLSKSGFKVAVATNQSGLARGLFTLTELEAMHNKMQSEIQRKGGSLVDIRYCPHLPDDNCACRKPKPGMLLAISHDLQIDPKDCYFVGDSLSDITAGFAAGIRPALVLTGKGVRSLKKAQENDLHGVPIFNNLLSFTDFLVEQYS